MLQCTVQVIFRLIKSYLSPTLSREQAAWSLPVGSITFRTLIQESLELSH